MRRAVICVFSISVFLLFIFLSTYIQNFVSFGGNNLFTQARYSIFYGETIDLDDWLDEDLDFYFNEYSQGTYVVKYNSNYFYRISSDELVAIDIGETDIKIFDENGKVVASCRVDILQDPDPLAFTSDSYVIYEGDAFDIRDHLPDRFKNQTLTIDYDYNYFTRGSWNSLTLTAKDIGTTTITIRNSSRHQEATCTITILPREHNFRLSETEITLHARSLETAVLELLFDGQIYTTPQWQVVYLTEDDFGYVRAASIISGSNSLTPTIMANYVGEAKLVCTIFGEEYTCLIHVVE